MRLSSSQQIFSFGPNRSDSALFEFRVGKGRKQDYMLVSVRYWKNRDPIVAHEFDTRTAPGIHVSREGNLSSVVVAFPSEEKKRW